MQFPQPPAERSTLKSPPSRGLRPSRSPKTAKTPLKVHLRLRFQNLGKPRTAGLCGGLRTLATAALYLVLKSNGLRHSKNPPVKFGFSSKTVPANIVQKLPSQRCSKPLFHPDFQPLSQTAHVRSHSESGYTLAFRRKIAHNGSTRRNRGLPFCVTVRLCAAAKSLLFHRAFIYIHFPVLCEPHHQAEGKIKQNCVTNAVPDRFHPVFQLRSQTAHVRFTGESGYTLGFRRRIAHNGHTAKQGRFGWGWYHYPRSVPHVQETLRAGFRTAYFAAFGSWSEALLKNAESLRDSDALMRVAVPRRRGPAGLRDLFSFLSKLWLVLRSELSVVRGRGGITTLGALCVLLKRWTAACQKGSFAAF